MVLPVLHSTIRDVYIGSTQVRCDIFPQLFQAFQSERSSAGTAQRRGGAQISRGKDSNAGGKVRAHGAIFFLFSYFWREGFGIEIILTHAVGGVLGVQVEVRRLSGDDLAVGEGVEGGLPPVRAHPALPLATESPLFVDADG